MNLREGGKWEEGVCDENCTHVRNSKRKKCSETEEGLKGSNDTN